METAKQSIKELKEIIYQENTREHISSDVYHQLLTRIDYLEDKFLNGEIRESEKKSVCDCIIPSPDKNRTYCFKCDAQIPLNRLKERT